MKTKQQPIALTMALLTQDRNPPHIEVKVVRSRHDVLVAFASKAAALHCARVVVILMVELRYWLW